MNSRRFGLVSLFAAFVAVARPAHACWDGDLAHTDNVTIMGADETWNAQRARDLARWLPRISALVSPNDRLEVEFGHATLTHGEHDLGWTASSSLEGLFREVASRTSASREARRTAMELEGVAQVVQLGAYRSEASARALVERVAATGLDAEEFYSAGGFPATRPGVHIEATHDRAGRPLFRVLYGSYLRRADSIAHRDQIRRSLGIAGFVRTLG